MKIVIKKRNIEKFLFSLAGVSVLASMLVGLSFTSNTVIGASTNVTNQTVLGRVNISNNAPSLSKVVLSNNDSIAQTVDLIANDVTNVICNGTFSDSNGFDDVVNVSAVIYDVSAGSGAADDNNNHYTNGTCGTCTLIPNSNNENGTCICQFAVQYYANPANWQCNMTINDTASIGSILNSSVVGMNEVLGIDVETAVLDFGNLSVLQISDPRRENVTNTGNIPLNVTVRGYGGDNESVGENLTMICESGANITFGNERYYHGNNTPFSQMFNLTNQTRPFVNLTIPKRTNEASFGNSSNSTYWQLRIPAGASGVCNGTIIFGAVDGTDP
jgi:hypothetical protein